MNSINSQGRNCTFFGGGVFLLFSFLLLSLSFLPSSFSLKSVIVSLGSVQWGPRCSCGRKLPPGSLNRVPALAGVEAGMSPLPGGR